MLCFFFYLTKNIISPNYADEFDIIECFKLSTPLIFFNFQRISEHANRFKKNFFFILIVKEATDVAGSPGSFYQTFLRGYAEK